MPCMGPEQPSKDFVQEVTDSVLQHLNVHYSVFEDWAIEERASNYMRNTWRKERSAVKKQLSRVIHQILWQDACEKF